MAIRIISKTEISRLPNTYYCVFEETSGFFNSKVRRDHSFHVKGSNHCVGFYNAESEQLYESFVHFLNSGLTMGKDFYLNYSKSSKCIELIKAISNQIPRRISILRPTPPDYIDFSSYEFWSHSAFSGVGQINNKRVESFKLDAYNKTISFSLAGSEKVVKCLTRDEFIFIRDFIVISFLVFMPTMVSRTFFTITSDMNCIEKAVEKGWIK